MIDYDQVEIDNLGKCQECEELNVLDSTLNICFDCWCLLDVKEHEKLQINTSSNEEE